MRSSGLRLAVASILVALCASFKDQEFKKCGDAGFCRRNLRKTGPEFSITSAEVVGSSVVAVLQNDGAAVSMELKLVAFEDRFVRLIVDEHVDVGRYKISDLIQEPVLGREATWEVIGQSAASLSVKIDQMVATLNFKPFQLEVKISGSDAVTLNSRNMFNFEHRRQKPEGDDGSACDGCWEETFRSSTDSKKNGPEAISLDLGFPGFDHVYGIPEHATSMALKPTVGGEPYRMYNLDVFEYLVDHYFGLYGSIPFMLAHKKGLTTGVLWLNAAEMFIDVEKVSGGTATQWVSEAGIVDLFIFSGPTPADVVKQYAVLTGTTALPQLFAIGYHQCRWNYKDEADAFAVDAGFDEHAIPYDVLWLDIEHTNGKRYLTWDSQHFPNPQDMQNDIGSRGREMVTIVDPHVKRDQGYYIFKEATDAGFFVQNSAGGVFDGWCWPGSSSYLDVNSPEVRNWWAQQFTLDKYQGSTKHLYIWNDMNEPSVFNGPEVTFPKDNIHAGGVEHREVHNLYGLYYHMATADGLKVRGDTLDPEGDRPFVLSRAFFTGTQRVGPIWTGDNAADWDHLRISIPMLLTLGVTGLPFSGADVGGFFGNPTPELLTRWYQVGIYYPFFRGHAHLDTARREPWLFGEETTDRLREAIRTRYALLPYMYTLFRHANTTGVPVMRPLFYEFPEEEATFAIEEEFMLGPGLLVKPVISQDVTQVPVYLPSGCWYNSKTGTPVSSTGKVSFKVNMDSIPSFYRGGHIIPRRERPRRSTAAMANDPFTLVVALDDKLKASGDLYLDDGRTFAFKKGHFLHREFSFDNLALSSARGADVIDSADGSTQKGAMESNLTIERIVFLGLKAGTKYTAVLPGGQKVTVEPGPLNMRFPSTDAHVLARPNLPIAADWTIQLKEQ